MMKNKTYNNVMRLAKAISKKGYDLKESADLAVNCFDKSVGTIYSPEHFANMIISKEQWERETELYNINR
jgi:hypothetical protein